jgi:chloride channel protein, CIC family
MTAIVFSTVISRNLNRGSIYTLGLTRRGIDFHRQVEAGILGTITVSKAMTRNYPSIPPTMPIPTLLEEFHNSGHHGFPVVDENGIFSGIVTLTDIEDSMSENEPSLTAGDIATKNPIVAYPDQSVHDALAQLGGRNVGRIPVVDRSNPRKLLGILRRPDIVKAYTMAVEKQKDDL